MLEIRNLESGYGGLQVIRGVSVDVSEGEFVALIGPNGAGKSTTLKTVSGLLEPSAGTVRLLGESIGGLRAHVIHRKGISFVPETLNLFPKMSVHENLLMGAYGVRDREKIRNSMARVLQLFPRLAERHKQLAATLSGGERRMLGVARGLMSEPKILLVDEPSLGLAPKLVLSVFNTLKELNREGVSILLVEQNVRSVLEMTDRCYVMEQGRIVLEGPSSEVKMSGHVQRVYFGQREPAADKG